MSPVAVAEVEEEWTALLAAQGLCYFCDPYQYRNALIIYPGMAYLVCEAHLLLSARRHPPDLPPGWQASWKRGIWA